MSQEKIDQYLSKFLSRKLLVWLTATGLLIANKITPEEWSTISVGYVGIEGFADLMMRYKVQR